MIFNEIHGSYYKALAELLRWAVGSGQGAELGDLRPILRKYAFAESGPAIESAITEERWQVIRADGATAVSHEPSLPLTDLEKRWLKALSLDPRARLFDLDFSFLGDTEPLFTPADYEVFDKYADGDPYEDPDYIQNFRLILSAVRDRTPLRLGITNRKGALTHLSVIPEGLEYSEKDDKFRLLTSGTRRPVTVNLGRIVYCRPFRGAFPNWGGRKRNTARSVTLLITDRRNALERVLLHFSHFEKEAEHLEGEQYRLTLRYSQEDETELVIRILSFGPLVRVVEPYSFVDLIRERLKQQKSCGL